MILLHCTGGVAVMDWSGGRWHGRSLQASCYARPICESRHKDMTQLASGNRGIYSVARVTGMASCSRWQITSVSLYVCTYSQLAQCPRLHGRCAGLFATKMHLIRCRGMPDPVYAHWSHRAVQRGRSCVASPTLCISPCLPNR
jgi:hypothetical protein